MWVVDVPDIGTSSLVRGEPPRQTVGSPDSFLSIGLLASRNPCSLRKELKDGGNGWSMKLAGACRVHELQDPNP